MEGDNSRYVVDDNIFSSVNRKSASAINQLILVFTKCVTIAICSVFISRSNTKIKSMTVRARQTVLRRCAPLRFMYRWVTYNHSFRLQKKMIADKMVGTK